MTTQQIDKLFTKDDFVCRNRTVYWNGKKIGVIVFHEGELYLSKYDEEKHIFRKLNAWSIPQFIFDKIDRITVYTTKNIYRIKKADVPKTYLHFQQAGIELKVYIPLDLWEISAR